MISSGQPGGKLHGSGAPGNACQAEGRGEGSRGEVSACVQVPFHSVPPAPESVPRQPEHLQVCSLLGLATNRGPALKAWAASCLKAFPGRLKKYPCLWASGRGGAAVTPTDRPPANTVVENRSSGSRPAIPLVNRMMLSHPVGQDRRILSGAVSRLVRRRLPGWYVNVRAYFSWRGILLRLGRALALGLQSFARGE